MNLSSFLTTTELGVVEEIDFTNTGITNFHMPHLNLKNLKKLNLSHNSLQGNISTWIDFLSGSSIETLDLSNNELNGTIPTNLDQLSTLVNLCLKDNDLRGTIPEQFGNMTRLKRLDLSKNRLMGPIPTTIGKMSSLVELNAASNGLGYDKIMSCHEASSTTKYSIPPELGNLTNLTVLILSHSGLGGPIPAMNSLNLTEIHLQGNYLSDTMPSFSSFEKLRELRLSDNENLTGGLDALENLLHLKRLEIHGTNITVDDKKVMKNLCSTNSDERIEIYVDCSTTDGGYPNKVCVFETKQESCKDVCSCCLRGRGMKS